MVNIKPIEKPHNNCDNTFQSIELIFQFIHHITELKSESIIELYPKIIVHILHWTQYLDLYQQTVPIMQTIINIIRINNNCIDLSLQCDINEKLEESLNVSLKSINHELIYLYVYYL